MEIIKLEKAAGKETERLWRDRIDATIQWRRDRRMGDKQFKSSKNLFEGKHWTVSEEFNADDISSDNPNDLITVNLVGSTVQDFIPFLVRSEPRFELVPTTETGVKSYKTATAYYNWAWREYGMQKQFRRAVQDGLVIGHGIVKTGFKFQLEAIEDKSGRIAYNDNVRFEAPHISRIDPRRFYFEPGAGQFDLESARWCFEVMFMTWQDVVENPLFSDRVRRKIKAGTETPETIQDYLCKVGRSRDDDEFVSGAWQSQQLVVLYEIWDKKYNKYWIFAGNVDSPLVEETNPYPYLDGFPYAMWRYQELNDEPMGLGVPQVMRDQQHELNRIRTTEFQHRRNYGKRKWQILRDGVEDEEIKNMLAADADYFYTNHPDGAKPHDSPALPPDNYRVQNTIQEDIRQLTGQDELQRGGSLPSRTSAAEIRARQGIMGTKTTGRSTLVDEFLSSIGRQVLQHTQANVETAKVVRVSGDNNPESYEWLTMTPEDIREEFELRFESTSRQEVTPAEDKAMRAQLFERAVQAAPFMREQGKQVDLAELFKWSLEPFERKVELDRFFLEMEPQPAEAGGPAPGSAQPASPEEAATFAGSVQPGSTAR